MNPWASLSSVHSSPEHQKLRLLSKDDCRHSGSGGQLNPMVCHKVPNLSITSKQAATEEREDIAAACRRFEKLTRWESGHDLVR